MDGLAVEFAGRVAVVKVNVGMVENEAIQQSYGLRGHPTAVVLNANHEVVERYYGAEEVEVLREVLTAVSE